MTRIPRDITPETYITSHEAGTLLQSNPSTINKWVKEGRIKAHATPGGHRRIRAADLVAFLAEYKMPIPDGLRPAELAPEPLENDFRMVTRKLREHGVLPAKTKKAMRKK